MLNRRDVWLVFHPCVKARVPFKVRALISLSVQLALLKRMGEVRYFTP